MSVESASAQIEYRHPATAPTPGPLASRVLAPLPWPVWPVLAVMGLAPWIWLLGFPLTPNYLYFWPVIALYGFVLSATPICGVGMIHGVVRHLLATRYRLTPTRQGGRPRTWIAGLAIYWLVCGTPLALKLGFVMRRAAFEDVREHVAAGTILAGPTTILPFRVSDAEQYDDGVVVVYTEGSRGDFPGGGSGFLYLPVGVPFPKYNEGSDGHVAGQWYWFVTD